MRTYHERDGVVVARQKDYDEDVALVCACRGECGRRICLDTEINAGGCNAREGVLSIALGYVSPGAAGGVRSLENVVVFNTHAHENWVLSRVRPASEKALKAAKEAIRSLRDPFETAVASTCLAELQARHESELDALWAERQAACARWLAEDVVVARQRAPGTFYATTSLPEVVTLAPRAGVAMCQWCRRAYAYHAAARTGPTTVIDTMIEMGV